MMFQMDRGEHFFEVYKMLEPDKKTTAIGYAGRQEAVEEVERARERFASRGE